MATGFSFADIKIADKFSILLILMFFILLIGLLITEQISTNQELKAKDLIFAADADRERRQTEEDFWDNITLILNLAADNVRQASVNALRDQDTQKLRSVAENIAKTTNTASDLFRLKTQGKQEKIAYIRFTNATGETLLKVDVTGLQQSPFSVYRSVFDQGQLIGFIEVAGDVQAVEEILAQQLAANTLLVQELRTQTQNYRLANMLILAFGFVILSAILFFISRLAVKQLITDPLDKVSNTLTAMKRRDDFSARLAVDRRDEIGELTQQFNDAFAHLATRNEAVNDAVINLLTATSEISQQHNLAVKIPVTEDITGLIADGLNQLTAELATVLKQVEKSSAQVAQTSLAVNTQNQEVIQAAQNEQETLGRTTESLRRATQILRQIASLSQASDKAGQEIRQAISEAFGVLQRSIQGIDGTRDNIQEISKRIKRLGERSQEITVIVDIINNIAERTNVLALNAGIQAAAAGDAGRTFTVIAAEVQRLAESSQNATSQISTLIKNIQAETTDTMQAMEKANSEVVAQAKLIETAGSTMQKSQASVDIASEAIGKISKNSLLQLKSSQELLQELEKMRVSIDNTRERLEAQGSQVTALTSASSAMLQSIRIFKLPS